MVVMDSDCGKTTVEQMIQCAYSSLAFFAAIAP